MGLFRDNSLDGENYFAEQNKHNWLDAFGKGKRTRKSRGVRRAQIGRLRKQRDALPQKQKPGTWSLW